MNGYTVDTLAQNFPSRDFDFSIHSLPNRRAGVTYGIDDKNFSDVKYLTSGSNTIVYTALKNEELLAVKMLKSNKKIAVDEMNLEMHILSKVDHENIVRINGAGEQPRKFIVLEYLSGGTLDRRLSELKAQEKKDILQVSSIQTRSSFRWQTALPIAIQLASALKYLHDDFHPHATIIHRGTQ